MQFGLGGQHYATGYALVVACIYLNLLVVAATGHLHLLAMLAGCFAAFFIAQRHAGHFAAAIVQLYGHARCGQTVQCNEQYDGQLFQRDKDIYPKLLQE